MKTLPKDIAANLAEALSLERTASSLGSLVNARAVLERSILAAINAEKKRADELAATLDRIASGGV